MSASIFWKPITPDRNGITPLAPSRQIDILTNLFGEGPWHLTQAHLPMLRTTVIVAERTDIGTKDFFSGIVNALEHHDEIEVWAEY